MAQTEAAFQPGKILHESIVGAFRAKGLNLNAWCVSNGIGLQNARNATHGLSGGPAGTKLLGRMIEAAGPETVAVSYRHRMSDEAAKLESPAAAVAA